MPPPNPANLHLPPHLREVCAILAAGLVRLPTMAARCRRRTPEKMAGFTATTWRSGC